MQYLKLIMLICNLTVHNTLGIKETVPILAEYITYEYEVVRLKRVHIICTRSLYGRN